MISGFSCIIFFTKAAMVQASVSASFKRVYACFESIFCKGVEGGSAPEEEREGRRDGGREEGREREREKEVYTGCSIIQLTLLNKN
jgi:hypothetical protein